jgi:23S rRNA (adenine2503-C2)-methyltransferase
MEGKVQTQEITTYEKSITYGDTTIEILSAGGRQDVAEVFVGAMDPEGIRCIEFVDGLDTRFPREEKWIINLSTQFGCPVGCIFCDAGGNYQGNLSLEQMLAQVAYIAERHPQLKSTCKKLKVHFARMGEPSLNNAVPETMAALPEMFNNPDLWCCVPTVAPAGRDQWFERLFEVKEQHFRGRFQLQFSVNSTSQTERERLMPVKLWGYRQIADYGQNFFKPGDRKVVLNFALVDGVNFDPEVIEKYFEPDCFAIKLTPINPTFRGNQAGLKTILRSEKEDILQRATAGLMDRNFELVISIGDGREDEIGSNCGQAVRLLGKRDSETAIL